MGDAAPVTFDAGADGGASGADGGGLDAGFSGDSGEDAGTTVDSGPDSAQCDLLAAFGAPVALSELDGGATSAHLTADQLSIYFESDSRPGGQGDFDIWVASRGDAGAPFGTPVDLAGVNTSGPEREPSVTGDGAFLYATTGTAGAFDIVMASRGTPLGVFSALSLVPGLNGAGSDHAPYVLPDHSAVYFTSDRGGNVDLYRAARSGGAFQAPAPVLSVNTTAIEETAVVTQDERTIFFSSNRAPKSGNDYDIYIAQRAVAGDPFGTAVALDALNGNGADYPTWVSPDGCALYFTKAGALHYVRRGQ